MEQNLADLWARRLGWVGAGMIAVATIAIPYVLDREYRRMLPDYNPWEDLKGSIVRAIARYPSAMGEFTRTVGQLVRGDRLSASGGARR